MADDPNPVEMLASAAVVAFQGRRMIESINRSLPSEMMTALDTLYCELATVGGAAMLMARHLGIDKEVERMVAQSAAHQRDQRGRVGKGGRA